MRENEEFPEYPSDAERDEAERRRNFFSIDVHGGHEVRKGLLRPTDDGYSKFAREYFPLAKPAVLSDFARLTVGDEAGLIVFANHWGMLGYDALPDEHPPYQEWTGGDPVAWIWAHLAGIQVALKVHQLWRRQDTNGISAFVAGRNVPRQTWVQGPSPNKLLAERKFPEAQEAVARYAAGPPAGAELGDGALVMAGQSRRIALALYPPDMTSFRATWAILRGIINPNLRGVHAEISHWGDMDSGAKLIVQAFDGLISVIYRHLFEIVVGGNVEDCRECGTPFKQTDGRQRFCPPPAWARESLCAMRFHKREQRRRARTSRAMQ